MIVAKRSKNKVPLSKNEEKIINRTILGVSKDPVYELNIYNINGATRNSSPVTCQFDINGTNVTNLIDVITEQFKPLHKFDYSRISQSVKVSDIVQNDENVENDVKQSIRRSSRKRFKEGPVYTLALIIDGFGNNRLKAQRFCELWNRKSRGSIPRAALGVLFAEVHNLTVYADLQAVFGQPFEHVVIESQGNHIVVKPKTPCKINTNQLKKRKKNQAGVFVNKKKKNNK